MDELDSRSTSSSINESISSQTSNRSLRIAERERRNKDADDPFVVAMNYFSNFEAGTVIRGNHVLENNLALVESVAHSKGLPPEAISVMLELTMSSRIGSRSNSVSVRVLKCLIPATVVPQDAVCRAVVWIFVGKIPISTQVIFLKWVLTMYDMIDSKDHLRSMYGFLFSLVMDSDLWPYVCHLLCLLTRKECVRLYRVRKLLELVTKLGQQPVLLHLLALYKMFCPELVPCSFSSKMKARFRNYNSAWKTSLAAVQKSNACTVASVLPSGATAKKTISRKRKHRAHLELPVLCAVAQMETQNDPFYRNKLVPMIQMQSFSELLNNLGNIELPAQMGSLLGSHLALHYLDCVQDDSAYLRLNAWVGNALAEEVLCRSDEEPSSSEDTVHFLERLLTAQSFLQEGLSSTEIFLNSFLSIWDGSHLRPQILRLLSFYPVVPTSHMKQLLFEPIMQLFCTSTVFFKCGVIDSLKNMLQRWLTWHSVYAVADSNSLDISLHSHDNPKNMTLSAFKDSVMEVVNFVGHLSSLGLQLEHCHALLLSISLDFYEMVCDIFMKYGLPLVVMPPKGVFYPALFCTEPISVDRLAHIMYRYKMNLTAAKEQERQTKDVHFSRQTWQEFNHYALCMINCLWNIKTFKTGMDLLISQEQLSRGKVPDFDLSHHPAFLIYAIDFHRQCWPESRDIDLNSIKSPKEWYWYKEYLYAHFEGLKEFATSMINQRVSRVTTPLKQGPH